MAKGWPIFRRDAEKNCLYVLAKNTVILFKDDQCQPAPGISGAEALHPLLYREVGKTDPRGHLHHLVTEYLSSQETLLT